MNCYICDNHIPDIQLDENFKPKPCVECQDVIRETVYDVSKDCSDELGDFFTEAFEYD